MLSRIDVMLATVVCNGAQLLQLSVNLARTISCGGVGWGEVLGRASHSMQHNVERQVTLLKSIVQPSL
jgi:hypothetical protein